MLCVLGFLCVLVGGGGGMVTLGWLQGESYHVCSHGVNLQCGGSVFIVFL